MGLDVSKLDKETSKQAKLLGLEPEDFENEESLKSAMEAEKNKNIKKKDDKDDTDDPEYLKSEMKKAIAARDTAKAERNALRRKVEEFEEKIKEAVDPESVKTMKKELEDLKKFKAEEEARKEEEELKSKTEFERKEIQFNKKFETFKQEMEVEMGKVKTELGTKATELSKSQDEINRLRRVKLSNEIMETARSLKAYSPKQIVKLLESEFDYDKDSDSYIYKVVTKGKVTDEKTVEERVKEFLADPDNDNLVEATVNKKGFNTNKDDKGTGNHKKDYDQKKYGKYNPNDPKIIEEADDKGLSVDDFIDTLLLRDTRLELRNKKD